MPNYEIQRECERLARLAWPDHAGKVRAIGSRTQWRKSRISADLPPGTKAIEAAGRLLAYGSSFRAIRDDLRRLLESRGINPWR